ncbi:hypothetical protein BTO01_26830 [Vibrio jasicida]|nr:hypothetical protein BTO01_26830 [Vibrio jasicida]
MLLVSNQPHLHKALRSDLVKSLLNVGYSVAAFGVFSSIASGIQFGLGLIISALMLWVTKFFVCGISYTFIQIAKNTNPNTIDEDA